MTCNWCHETVTATDTFYQYANGPIAHRNCALRQVIGSVAHLERRCGCYVSGASDGDPDGLTRRQAATLAVQRWRELHC